MSGNVRADSNALAFPKLTEDKNAARSFLALHENVCAGDALFPRVIAIQVLHHAVNSNLESPAITEDDRSSPENSPRRCSSDCNAEGRERIARGCEVYEMSIQNCGSLNRIRS